MRFNSFGLKLKGLAIKRALPWALFSLLIAPAAAMDFDKLSWLQGCWSGPGFGGTISECWVKTPDQIYTSVFQLEVEGKQVFSEIVSLAEFDGPGQMRVRHFTPGFEQWESDKGSYQSFELVEIGDDYILFEGLEYHLEDDQLSVALDIRGKDGTATTHRFVLKRQ